MSNHKAGIEAPVQIIIESRRGLQGPAATSRLWCAAPCHCRELYVNVV
jgi:hypothetical protein